MPSIGARRTITSWWIFRRLDSCDATPEMIEGWIKEAEDNLTENVRYGI